MADMIAQLTNKPALLIDLNKALPPGLLRRFTEEMDNQDASPEEMVITAVHSYLYGIDHMDTSDEEIARGIAEGIVDVLTGNTVDARQALAEIEEEIRREQYEYPY